MITNGPGELAHVTRSSEAIDFSPRGWSDIYAAKAGTVYINRDYTDWGNLVIVAHADGFYTYYAHLANPGIVGEKTPVAQGEKIGVVGHSGSATAVHLHLEARDGMTSTPTFDNAAYGGDSTNHSLRRIRGIGWFPWWPLAGSNSGYTVVAATPHAPNYCVRASNIMLEVLAHSEFTHSNTEESSVDITRNQKDFLPPTVVSLSHGIYRADESFAPEAQKKKHWVHVRAYDETEDEWANDDEVAHQGPYPIGLNCPPGLPPGYQDNIPDDEP